MKLGQRHCEECFLKVHPELLFMVILMLISGKEKNWSLTSANYRQFRSGYFRSWEFPVWVWSMTRCMKSWWEIRTSNIIYSTGRCYRKHERKYISTETTQWAIISCNANTVTLHCVKHVAHTIETGCFHIVWMKTSLLLEQ